MMQGEATMKLRGIRLLAAVAVLAAVPTVALLAQDAKVVDDRQAVMKAMGKDMGAVKTLLGGPASELGQAKVHAASIAEEAGKIPSMFPEGSDVGDSEALPAVWSDRAGFEQAAARLGELANKLSAAADTGDAKQVTAAFADLGKNGCGGCHQTYRKPQS
jgi:cytochrome c556